MNTCFIFFKPTQSNESSAIVLDNKACVIQPLKTYSVTEIYRLQQQSGPLAQAQNRTFSNETPVLTVPHALLKTIFATKIGCP